MVFTRENDKRRAKYKEDAAKLTGRLDESEKLLSDVGVIDNTMVRVHGDRVLSFFIDSDIGRC